MGEIGVLVLTGQEFNFSTVTGMVLGFGFITKPIFTIQGYLITAE